MKSFKQYLLAEESTEVSTALETVLGVSYESVSKGKPKILNLKDLFYEYDVLIMHAKLVSL